MAITDKESAQAWLEKQPQDVGSVVVTRGVLRAVPGLGSASNDALEKLCLPVFRAVILSSTGAIMPSPELIDAASSFSVGSARTSKFDRDSEAAKQTATSAFALVGNLRTASAGDLTTTPSKIASYSGSAAFASGLSSHPSVRVAARSAFFSAVDADSQYIASQEKSSSHARGLFGLPLWPTQVRNYIPPGEPDGLAHNYQKLVAFLETDPKTWGFWHRWLEGMRNGQPMDWELQRRVALIEDEIWQEGAKAVAENIREIEEHYWSNALPQHEVLERDATDGKFTVTAAAFDGESAVEGWLKQIEFAVSLAVDSNTSDFNRMCTAFKYIDHTLENCRNDPNAIEQHVGVAREIIDSNLNDPEYASDDSLRALARVLEQIQIQMRADHPDVRKAWEKRIAQKLREVDRDKKVMAAEAIRSEIARTKGRAEAEMLLDAETVATSESTEAQAIALRRAGGRSAKMNAMERASETVHRIDKSAGYKGIRIAGTGYNVGDIVWMLKDLLGF